MGRAASAKYRPSEFWSSEHPQAYLHHNSSDSGVSGSYGLGLGLGPKEQTILRCAM